MTELALHAPQPRWPWARDFAVVGGLTGFLAPFAIFQQLLYALLTGFGGALGGGLLGLFSAWLLSGNARRWSPLAFLPLGLVVGALWGVSAALPTVVLGTEVLFWSLLVAGFAGAVQLAWLWPLYCHRRLAGRSTAALVVLSSLVGGSLGWLTVLAVVRMY